MKILFVCTGNMCRSPAAEKMLELYGAGAGFETRSRGTAAQPYCSMPARVKAFLKRTGAVDTAHKPALVNEADINWADLILVMEEIHAEILADKFPQSMRKTRRFLDHCGTGGDLPDPMGKSDAIFEKVMEQIKEGIKTIIAGG